MGLGQLQQWVPPGAAPPPPGMHYTVTEWSAAIGMNPPVPIKWELVPDKDGPLLIRPPEPPLALIDRIPWWGWLVGAGAALYFLTQKR